MPSELRRTRIVVNLSSTEHAAFEAHARETGQSGLSPFLRHAGWTMIAIRSVGALADWYGVVIGPADQSRAGALDSIWPSQQQAQEWADAVLGTDEAAVVVPLALEARFLTSKPR